MIIILHGYGASGDDFLSLGKLLQTKLRKTTLLLPHAPFLKNAPFPFRGWFPINAMDRDSLKRGAESCREWLTLWIQQEADKRRLPLNKILLAGFSQGGMLALELGLYGMGPCAGVICYAGGSILTNPPIFRPPVQFFHGEADDVVPVDYGRKAYQELLTHGVESQITLTKNTLHTIDPTWIDPTLRFCEKQLANPEGPVRG